MMAGGPKTSSDEEPLRVVFFTASYFVLDGVTLTIRKILEACKQAGHETMVITAAPIADTMGELGELNDENLVLVPGMPVPMEKEHYGYALGLGLSQEARSKLEEFKPHVAHFTVCDLLGMDGVFWAKQNGVALVGTWHSNYCDYVKFYSGAWWLTPVLRRYIQQFYGAIPTTYVPTDFMRHKLKHEGYDQFTDMQVWGRGIDLNRFHPKLRRSETFRRRHGCRPSTSSSSSSPSASASSASGGAASASVSLGASGGVPGASSAEPCVSNDILIIWVGRLVPEKRPDIWRDVFLKLVAEGLPVKGLVVGVGPCQAMLEAIPGVKVAGWLSGLALAEAYASADVLLFPSDVETFGNVTLEALGSGIPAVVEEQCSRHLVTDGQEGFAVHQGIGDPKDKHAYDACVGRYLIATRKLVVDPILRQRCGLHALAKAATYTNEAVQGRMIGYYYAAYRSQIGEFGFERVEHAIAKKHKQQPGGNGGNGNGNGNGNGGKSGETGDAEDPNDKGMHRSKRALVGAYCARALCWWWSLRWSKKGCHGLLSDAAHHVWSWLARIVIFVLWLLLGLPHVTTTSLAETNIRQGNQGGDVVVEV